MPALKEKQPRKRKTGPISDAEKVKFRKVCDIISEGKSLRSACKVKGTPCKSLFLEWLADRDDDGSLADQYTRATAARPHAMFEEMLEISNTGNKLDVARARLRVETRKWALGKMNPKKYGDKVIHAGDEDHPVHTKTTIDVTQISDTALAELMAARRETPKTD